jgi:hypothetical protein
MDFDQVLSHRYVLGSLAGTSKIAKATFGEGAASRAAEAGGGRAMVAGCRASPGCSAYMIRL